MDCTRPGHGRGQLGLGGWGGWHLVLVSHGDERVDVLFQVLFILVQGWKSRLRVKDEGFREDSPPHACSLNQIWFMKLCFRRLRDQSGPDWYHAVKRIWHTRDSQGQILALALR